MKNKRGLSTVVATILIIAITVVAVVLIARVIIPFVRENLDKSTRCLDYGDYFQFKESFEYQGKEYKYNCYNLSSENLYAFSIQTSNANLSSNIKGFKLILSKGESESVLVKEGQAQSSSLKGIRMLNTSASIVIPKEGEFYTYIFNAGQSLFTKAEIMPILTSEKVCPISDSIDLVPCSNVPLTSA